jgi:hypothetical protein|tara:strand:+ start:1111 stop:1584 length:474 start_codon:yes stop_codon:yes gene_type:complete
MITEFQGKYRFLSNFWPATVIGPSSIVYPTVEHAYQAAKTEDERQHWRIMHMNTPGMAKRAGRRLVMRSDWDEVKYDIMYELVKQKFFNNDELANSLMDTQDVPIIEGNMWHDNYWGSCHCSRHNGGGQNKMGGILMLVRGELFDRYHETWRAREGS